MLQPLPYGDASVRGMDTAARDRLFQLLEAHGPSGREREAVLQIEAAVAAAREELGGTVKAERMEALAAHGAALAAAACGVHAPAYLQKHP